MTWESSRNNIASQFFFCRNTSSRMDIISWTILRFHGIKWLFFVTALYPTPTNHNTPLSCVDARATLHLSQETKTTRGMHIYITLHYLYISTLLIRYYFIKKKTQTLPTSAYLKINNRRKKTIADDGVRNMLVVILFALRWLPCDECLAAVIWILYLQTARDHMYGRMYVCMEVCMYVGILLLTR